MSRELQNNQHYPTVGPATAKSIACLGPNGLAWNAAKSLDPAIRAACVVEAQRRADLALADKETTHAG